MTSFTKEITRSEFLANLVERLEEVSIEVNSLHDTAQSIEDSTHNLQDEVNLIREALSMYTETEQQIEAEEAKEAKENKRIKRKGNIKNAVDHLQTGVPYEATHHIKF